MECDFGSQKCNTLLSLNFRIQLLHQVAVTGILKALFVVASKSSIIQIVLVQFTTAQATAWIAILKELLTECVPFILQSDSELQLPVIPKRSVAGNVYGGCPDQETFNLHFYLCRKLVKLIRERWRPFPTARRIAPITIPLWNLTKGMTDTFSRVMMNVGAPFKQLQPQASVMMRYIMIMVYNAHLVNRAFGIEKRLNAPPANKRAIRSLDQLRHALKNEGSFMNSIGNLAREGFKISHGLFKAAIAGAKPEAAEDGGAREQDAAQGNVVVGLLCTSKNKSKVAFLNTTAGTALRQSGKPGSHVPVAQPLGSPTCLMCRSRTRFYCEACSNNTSDVKFHACVMPKTSGSSKKVTCFQKMHKVKAIVSQKAPKRLSDGMTTALAKRTVALQAQNAAKRKKVADDAIATQNAAVQAALSAADGMLAQSQ